jgi:Cof subfamily protein (haloacid dehalogenase superfamily)
LKKFNIQFFPATGRTRQGMVNVGGKELVELLGGDVSKISGVFNQGLIVYGHDGQLIHENYVSNEALETTEVYCEKHGLSLIGYYRDRIVTNRITALTEASSQGKEPHPELVENGLLGFHQGGSKLNKIMILTSENDLQKHRSKLENLLDQGAHVTQAVPGMLEVLPFGSSKGDGVKKLLDHFEIDPQNCIAFGDGENDLEMISLVQYGIAMSNAREKLLARAFRHTLSNDEDGVAFVIENILREPLSS